MEEKGIQTGKAMDHTGGLAAMVDNPEVLPSEKMHHLLVALRDVRAEAQERAAPFKAIIETESLKMGEAIGALLLKEGTIKAGIEAILETEFEDDKWKYKGKAGTAEMVKPKPRITYDVKGLETLRLSSDETERLLGHLRSVKPSKSYLRVKLK